MKKKLLGSVLVVAMIVSCLFAFTACNKPVESDWPTTITKGYGFTNAYLQQKAPATKPDKVTDITFVLDWTPNSNHTGLYVAQDLGYFEEEMLNVTFIQPGDTGTSAMVAAGTGQFGVDFQEQMIFNEKQGVNVTAVASMVQHNTSGIVSPKDRGIISPADMVGKKYATWSLPGEQAIIKSMVRAADKDPAEVNMVPNTVHNIIAEFQNPNGVDCVWSYAAWDKIMLDQAGVETNFIWMRDIPGLDYYTPVIICNNDFMNANPEVVKAFLRAATKGYEYAIKNPHAAADIMMKVNPELKESSDLMYASQDFLAREYQSTAPYWGYIDQIRWDTFFALMCEIGE